MVAETYLIFALMRATMTIHFLNIRASYKQYKNIGKGGEKLTN